MDIANLVLKHSFDKAMVDQINTLRTLRLTMAESMLRNLDGTSEALVSRGLVRDVSQTELHQELMTRVSTLRSRLQEPAILYADELDLYAELLDATLETEDEDADEED